QRGRPRFTYLLMSPCLVLDESHATMQQSPAQSGKEMRLVSLVLVSHSATLVDGLRAMVPRCGGDAAAVAVAAGTADGRLATGAPRITAPIRSVLDAGAS